MLIQIQIQKKPFSEEILELSSKIHSISPSAYQCLAEKLPFPSESYIQEMNHKITSNISALFQNVDKIPEIVDIWKSKSGINKSLTIYACLSVDALFFTPNIQINENSIFEGIVLDEKDELFVSKNIFTNFLNNPNDFQTFLRLNNDKIIRAGFVFQVQPYNPIYSTFIVHIKPASNGKANITIVNLLKKIKTILKNKNITIKSFSFDGDNGYSLLQNEYFNSYINSIIKQNTILFLRACKTRVGTDFLHLIKRLRYRLFGVDIHCGFLLSNNSFNIEKLKTIFDKLPHVIWNDEPYTKMHDSLPLILFSPENFLSLLEKRYFTEAAYFLPISLSILAYSYKNIGYLTRIYLLQVSLFFLVYYYNEMINCLKVELSETKRTNKHF